MINWVKIAVASFMDAWIEIATTGRLAVLYYVASFMDAWIEIAEEVSN